MRKMLGVTAAMAIVIGIGMLVGGIGGLMFTYQNVAREKIITPEDASIPSTPVQGPFTLKAQADIIRFHTLRTTNGLTYAEMPRQIAKVDQSGVQVLGVDGKQVMVANTARDMWVTATTLTNALNLGILSYAFSSIVALLGLFMVWVGVVFLVLRKRFY